MRTRSIRYELLWAGLFLVGSGLWLWGVAGCNQQTEAPVRQATAQETVTPTSTEQELGTQGSQVYTYIINAPGRWDLPQPGLTILQDGQVTTTAKEVSSTGGKVDSTTAGYVQGGITLNITTGGTTPSATGTTTGTGSGTQYPTASATASPTQDIRPELTGSVPIGVAMPGGMVDQQATATGRGTTSETGKTSTNRIDWMQMITEGVKELGAETVQQLLDLLKARQEPATQPE